ncbi:MAG: DUF3108 domain-containing protein [Bacteriovoracaceae bacterium]|nr:DUF3108 domain-containing protein [Bacteriovoracaceae bacterium]
MIKKLNGFLILFVIFFFVSCAAHISTDKKEKDLVETFNLKNGDFSKFKSEEALSAKPEQKKTEPKKIERKKEGGIQKVSTKSVSAITPQKSTDTTLPLNYPENFPEKYKAYDATYADTWKIFNPVIFPGEEYVLVVKYIGITAGYVTMKTMQPVQIAGGYAWHMKARLQSANFYKYIYMLDDSIESFVNKDTFLPVKFQLIQKESIQEVNDLQLFDDSKLKTFFWYKRIKRGKLRKHERSEFIPRFFQDSFSALFFARGLPLKKNVIYEFPIVTRAKVWILKLEVVGEDIIEIGSEKIPAIRIKAETRFPGVLKKKGDILFWFSKDKTRKFLQFRAKVKIGSLSGKLVKYKIPKK